MKRLTILFLISLTFFLCCKQKQNTQEIKPILEEIKEIKKDYWDNGKLASEGVYINGKANGLMKWYHNNGFIAGEGPMENGKRNGWWKVYDIEDGKLGAEGNFKAGIKHGVWKLYHKNGNTFKEQLWSTDTLVNTTEWDLNGNIVNRN